MNDWRRHLGVVVIGRNEAPRLGDCLDSLSAVWDRTVYVDSGSSDGSPRLAEERGVRVVQLHEGPFTAARGRQIGLHELLTLHPDVRYVQFVDGDCVIQPGWLEHGVDFLDRNARSAVVVGRLRERHADKSILLRLVDVDWDLPTGLIDAIGGISMARVSAIGEVGGWRTDLVAGEELDLGARLRASGWTLARLPEEMTLHDMGIRTFREFWRRSVRSGFSYAELAALHGRGGYRRWSRKAVGNFAYGAILPLLFVMSALAWTPGMAIVVGVYLFLVLRVAQWRIRRGDHVKVAVLYAVMLALCKSAAAIGTGKYVLMRIMGRQRRLIEYKSALSGEGS